MSLTPASTVVIRPVTADDLDLLLELANDPTTRWNAFNTQPITAWSHANWLLWRLQHEDRCVFFIGELDGEPIGQARFDVGPYHNEWELDYAVAPEFRGQGLGQALLTAAVEAFRRQHPSARILAHVKAGNEPSRHVLERVGFSLRSTAYVLCGSER